MSSRSRLAFFVGVALGLYLLRVALAYAAVPQGWLPALNLAASVVFVGLPIVALFVAAGYPWTGRLAVAVGFVGVALHAGVAALAGPAASPWVAALAPTGLIGWCASLGILLSMAIKDKNLLLPVAAFLAGFDMFLVFAPVGPTRVVLERAPKVFESAAMAVPRVAAEGESTGIVRALAYVGPADLFFLAMFFAAIYKFEMRVRETARWMAPVLVAYLLTVLFLGRTQVGPLSLGALPALVPIGVTVLLVNRREFRLTAQEKVATWGVVVISAALAAFGLMLALREPPKRPVAPSPSEGVQALRESGG